MKKIFVALSFVFVLFLFGCSQLRQLQPETQYICADGKTVVTSPSLCPAAAAPVAPASPAPATCAITLETELEVCSGMPEIQQASLEELCISGVAAKHKNVSLCKRLSYDGRKNCYLVTAMAANDAGICAGAGSDKDYCYQQYASNLKDASVCDKISDISNKDSCYLKIASDLADGALCDKIKTAGQKNSCYWDIAMRFRDSSYCDKITESSQKQNCQQNLQPSQQQSIPSREIK